ncbi:MAG: helix-turn-helix domain-containing protein [Candidatus Delongbacteria bacterium]|jgi:AraC-like DNA-binding protein|nr:helix-turn-helix domain-containing protein [Candidatus Delongbacteria bacterium]
MYDQLNDEEFCKEMDKLLKQFFSKKYDINKVLEDHFNKSLSSIRQRFKLNRRTTIAKYRDEILAQIASRMLKRKNCFDVMLHCGFSNPSHFAMWFRKMHGVNPSEYLTY